jgi:hypothetical protein
MLEGTQFARVEPIAMTVVRGVSVWYKLCIISFLSNSDIVIDIAISRTADPLSVVLSLTFAVPNYILLWNLSNPL